MIDQQNLLLARRSMYLAAYDQTIDAASFCANFLIAIFDSLEFGLPLQVDITSTGQYIALTAVGCSLAVAAEQRDIFSSVFDIANHQQHVLEDSYPSLAFLQPIVWFSEYCLMDISAGTKSYHQSFLYGSSSAQAIEKPRNDEPPRISFCFTLPVESFERTSLKIARLKRVVSLWKEKDFMRALPDQKHKLKLHFQWRSLAEDYFSLRIIPDTEVTQMTAVKSSLHQAHRKTQTKATVVGQ